MDQQDSTRESQQKQSESELFSQLISDDPQELEMLLTQTNQQISVCGAPANNYQLCFSCFTCSSDPQHLICAKCFDVAKHKNHKFILKDNSGCCDCGDSSIIPETICNMHQGYEKVSKVDWIEKISLKVQQNITQFIVEQNSKLQIIYNNLYTSCADFQPILLEIYFKIKSLRLQNLLQYFQQDEEFFLKLKEGVQLNNQFINFMSWLINKNSNFIFLITKILQQQNEVSGQTIFEDMIERQVVFELLGNKVSGITSLCYLFHADKEFKQFMHETYFKKLKNMFIYQKVNKKYLESLKTLKEYLDKLNQHQQQALLEDCSNVEKLLQKAISIRQNYDTILCQQSSFRSQHTQYCVLEMMDYFCLNLHDYALQNLRTLELIQYQNIHNDYSFQIVSILSFRYNCPWFKNILHKHLYQIDGMNQFDSQMLSPAQIDVLLSSNFFLFKFIEVVGSFERFELKFQDDELIVTNQDIINVGNLLIHQNSLLNMVAKCVFQLRSMFQSNIAKRNLSRILLKQSFKILLNKQLSAEYETECIKKFINDFVKDEHTEKEKIEKFQKLYLLILKRPVLSEQIIILLLYLEYFDGEFTNQKDFLTYIQQFISIEDDGILRQIFDHILSICVQNQVSAKFYQDARVLQIYQSSIANRPCQESIDLSFIRFYTYLYGDEGKQQFLKEIKKKQIPIYRVEIEIQDYMIRTLMSSHLELWNLLQFLEKDFENYPHEVIESQSDLITNIFTLGPSLSFQEIEKYSKMTGIQTINHFDILIKQVCQLEQSTKKFYLKRQEMKFYDPVHFRRAQVAQGKVYEKFIDQRIDEHFLIYGQYSNQIIQYIKNKYQNQNLLFSDFQLYFRRQEQLQEILNILQQENELSQISYQLYHYQFILEFEYNLGCSMVEIENIFNQRANSNQKESKLCQQLLENLKTIFQVTNQQKQNQQNKSQQQKNNMKQKFALKQQQLMQKLELDKIIELEERDDENCCHLCKQILNNQDKVTPILISTVPSQVQFEVLPNSLLNFVQNEKNNLTQWKIITCKHFFHFSCLKKSFSKPIKAKIPAWLAYQCPVCKQSSNIILPLTTDEKHQNDFFENLIPLLYELNVDSNLSSGIDDLQDIVMITFFSILFRMITDLFINKDEYIRSGKNQILKYFVQIIQKYCEGQNIEKQYLSFPQEQHFILDIMLILQQRIYNKIDQQEFQQSLINILNKIVIQSNKDTISIIFNCFDLNIDEMKIKKNVQIDVLSDFQQLEQNIVKKIQFLLGSNYETFRFNHLSKCCKKCGFYNQRLTKGKEISLCLLCLNLFCTYKCLKTGIGNLNQHAEESHQGSSIFIDIDSSIVYLVTVPITAVYEDSLYFDDLGQNADRDQHERWHNYLLEQGKIEKLAKMLLLNNIQPIIMNQVMQGLRINVQGNL